MSRGDESSVTPSTTSSTTPAIKPLAKLAFDWKPVALVLVVIVFAWPLVGSTSSWVTLTVAGLAMGLIVFIIASGLTLVFGLMDVLNFGHGVFIALGAYVTTSVMSRLGDLTQQGAWGTALLAMALAAATAMAVAAFAGLLFERFIVRPVYGQHLKQILITLGGAIVAEEVIKMIWGPMQVPLPLPDALRGSFIIPMGFGVEGNANEGAAIAKYRVLTVVVGLGVLAALTWTLTRTKVGLLVRAGVQDREMVESLGYHVRRLFVGVFVVASALAALGGVLWGLYQENVHPQLGGQVNVLLFIVIIMGGLGSTWGCFVGALLVGLMANYTGFLVPKVALFSNIVLMVAVLMWRPRGLYPVGGEG